MAEKPHSTLILNGQVIWTNPAGLGHAFIKLRKQILEEQIADRIEERVKEARRLRKASKTEDIWLPNHPGTEAETLAEIKQFLDKHSTCSF